MPAGPFDLIDSSLALRDLTDLAAFLVKVHAARTAGRGLVFSVDHPIMTAPTRQGWTSDADR